MKPQVFIGVPCRTVTNVNTMECLVDTVAFMRNEGWGVKRCAVRNRPVDLALNHIVESFLKSGDEYLFITADDHIFNPFDVMKLVEYCEDGNMISPIIPRKSPPFMPVIFDYEVRAIFDYPKNKVIDAVGSTCVMHRGIFEKFKDEYPDDDYFMYGKKDGEDIYFFKKILAAGVKPKVHTGIEFAHYGSIAHVYFFDMFKWKIMELARTKDNNGVISAKDNLKVMCEETDVKIEVLEEEDKNGR